MVQSAQIQGKRCTTCFVFDGYDCGIKTLRRKQRVADTAKWKAAAADSQTWKELDKANARLVRVNGHVVHAFCDWARNSIEEEKFCLLGSPFEADAQLINLEQHGFTDGTLSEDSDCYFYESSVNIYSGFNTRSTRKYRTIINRTTLNPYFSDLEGHSLRALASFCGSDYMDHLKGVGKCNILQSHLSHDIILFCNVCRFQNSAEDP